MDLASKASHLTPINIDEANASDPESHNVLGPLSSSAAPFTPYSVSRFSSTSRKSFTSEDFRREPEEAENMELQSIIPGQISMVRVLSKLAGKTELSRSKRKTRAEREGTQNLEHIYQPSESGGRGEEVGNVAEIDVNGEAYVLHEDGIFRPLNLCMSIKTHFKGYALSVNGIFKPLGGSPAAIEAGVLYRVTPTNKFTSADCQEQTSRALHRIKNVSQLLLRGTSGHEEYMYVYDPHWGGFVRTEETRRFPPETPMLKPGDLRSSVYVQNSEDLFASAEDALRKANRVEEVTNRQSLPPHKLLPHKLLSRSLTLPSEKYLSPRKPPNPIPQVPRTPAMLTKPINENTSRLDNQESWLNIDLPPSQQSPSDPTTPSDKPQDESSHVLSPVPEIPSFFAPAPTDFSPDDIIYESPSPNGVTVPSSQISLTAPGFNKPISRDPTADASQTAALYIPTLQQLVNECVLILYLRGSQASSHSKLARIVVPSSVSPDFDDMDLFLKIQEQYRKLQGFWRRWLSLRGLKHIALIECHKNNKHQTSLQIDDRDFSPEKLLENYLKPFRVAGDHHWVEWVHRLNCEETRYALEFIEGWRADKILFVALIPISLSISAAILWRFFYPRQQFLVAFIFGIFVMFLGWSIVGLLAVLSYIT